MNESLIKIWQDWKNVIIITILVIINITSLTWAPIVASWFKSNPQEIEGLSKSIQDTLWLVVFIYAAQIIFSNRRRRLEDKKKAEAEAAAQAESEVEEDAARLAEMAAEDAPAWRAKDTPTQMTKDQPIRGDEEPPMQRTKNVPVRGSEDRPMRAARPGDDGRRRRKTR